MTVVILYLFNHGIYKMFLKKFHDLFYLKPYFTIFLTVLVGFLCFMPSQNIPDVSTDDKTAHFVAFAVLGFSWFMYMKNYVKVLIGLTFFAIFIEVVQYLLPESFHRGFDLLDILADVLGIFIGFAVAFVFNKVVR
jgi:VanZ family protein